MEITFYFIASIHGLIHLMGFFKAFNLAKLAELTVPVSKTAGIIWGSAAATFSLSCILHYSELNYWWVLLLLSVSTSQFLIFKSWKDAKYGTIANLLSLFLATILYLDIKLF